MNRIKKYRRRRSKIYNNANKDIYYTDRCGRYTDRRTEPFPSCKQNNWCEKRVGFDWRQGLLVVLHYRGSRGKGLPIENLTSQYFANFYLSVLDHKAKEEWKSSIYIRYMDDIMIGGNDIDALRHCVRQMDMFASEYLCLSFKPPIYRKSKDGQTFLGYKMMPYHYKLSGRSKRRFRSKLLTYKKFLDEGKWTQNQYEKLILPLVAFTKHAVSKDFRLSCLSI